MQYVIDYQMVKYDRNGNGRAIATFYRAESHVGTATDGRERTRVELRPKARFHGSRDDVWDIVQRVQASGKAGVMQQDRMLDAYPRAPHIAAMSAGEYHAKHLGKMPAVEMPHVVIARVQNHADSGKR